MTSVKVLYWVQYIARLTEGLVMSSRNRVFLSALPNRVGGLSALFYQSVARGKSGGQHAHFGSDRVGDEALAVCLVVQPVEVSLRR